MPQFTRLKAPRLITACAGLTLLFANAGAFAQSAPEDEQAKALYAMGFMFGMQLSGLSLSESELNQMLQGLKDQANGNDPQVDPEAQMQHVQAFVQARTAESLRLARAGQQAYLDSFVEEGGIRTDSGLAYTITEEGKGDKPAATDTVEVHYEGRLIDGTVFDSSRNRGSTATFPLDQVIPGWTEGLQLIAPGGKIELVIPSDLGYGDNGSPPTIPGGATLIFDIELIDVK